MDNLIQNEAKMSDLKYKNSFGSIEGAEADKEATMFIKDPDTLLSMIVLLLTCLALAALADVIMP